MTLVDKVTLTGAKNCPVLNNPVLLFGHIKEKEAGLIEFGFLFTIRI